MKLVVYLRSVEENNNPVSYTDVRNEIVWFSKTGCRFSNNSTCMVCSEKFNWYWVKSNIDDTILDITYIKNQIISKNFYKRMKFDFRY